MFRLLNYLQYFLMRPLRFAMKRHSSFMKRMYRFGLFRFIYNIVIYFVAAPLRLVNAIWYDLLIYAIFSLRDAISDVFAPHTKKWTKKKNFVYFFVGFSVCLSVWSRWCSIRADGCLKDCFSPFMICLCPPLPWCMAQVKIRPSRYPDRANGLLETAILRVRVFISLWKNV